MRVHKIKTANAAKIPANKVLEDHTDKSYAADSHADDEHTPEICHSQKDNGFLLLPKSICYITIQLNQFPNLCKYDAYLSTMLTVLLSVNKTWRN